MNDEIKKAFPKEFYINKKGKMVAEITLENLNKIADYATNLQQKIEQYEKPDDLTLLYMWLDEKAKDMMKKLQQENERLKENAIHNDKVVDKARWNETIYKSRMDKAIEYIEKEYQDNIIITDYADNPITPQELYGELLDILKGDSDE